MTANGYLGYNFCGPVAADLIPQRLQNLCIRDFANAKKLAITFSVSEYFNSSESLMLMAQLEHLDKIAGFVFYSLLLLPINTSKRNQFFTAVLAQQKPIYFALEDLVCRNWQEAHEITKMFQISLDGRLNQTRKTLLQQRLGR